MLSRRDTLSPASDLPLKAYILLMAAVFLAIIIRLIYLQVVSGVELKISSLGNIIQDFATPAPRGDIYDRAGRPLAKNKQVFKLLYIRPPDLDKYVPSAKESKQLKEAGQKPTYLHSETGRSLQELQRLSAYLGLPYVELMRRVEKEMRRVYGNQPITLADNLSYPQVVYIEENREEYPRLLIDEYAFQRIYPLSEAAAHLVGYTGSMGPSENNSLRNLGYPQNEVVGKDGAERAYEEMLHGTPGIRYIRLNRSGLGVDFLRESSTDKNSAQYQVAPVKGSDIYLTVDSGLQDYAYRRLTREGKPGAVIINSLVEGHEGEILCMTSAPGFDPLMLKDDAYFNRLLADPRKPFTNRDFGLAYPPGSTFKIVTTAAAIQTKKFTLNNGYYCQGHLMIGPQRFNCHNKNGHHSLNLLNGFAKSCDVVFYQVGMGLPDQPDTLKEYAQYFGYGEKLGIDLSGEKAGVLPDRSVKRERIMAQGLREESELTWYAGDTAAYAIGQSFLKATPLQVLWSASIVAWDGNSYKPKLLYGKQADNRMVAIPSNRPEKKPLAAETLNALRQCMLAAVAQGGTCHKFQALGLEVGAKSGTAETGMRGKDDHSWVVGYYPVSNPKYGFVVFVENGGHGSETAIPVAYDILKYIHQHPVIPSSTPGTPSERPSGR